MIIKNNTNNPVEIHYYDRFNVSIKHALCIRPYGSHEVLPKDGIILFQSELDNNIRKGIISIQGDESTSVITPLEEVEDPRLENTESEIPKDDSPEGEDSVLEDNHESEDSSFVCEVCGKEFGSSRGLNKHMKSHES